MLTPKQKKHFDVFGFLCLRQAFSPDEMAEIAQAADQVWREDRGGQPQGPAPFAEQNPRLLDVAEDDRIFQVAADLLGPDFLWSGSEGNYIPYTEGNCGTTSLASRSIERSHSGLSSQSWAIISSVSKPPVVSHKPAS